LKLKEIKRNKKKVVLKNTKKKNFLCITFISNSILLYA
jgi:hypothetical protein